MNAVRKSKSTSALLGLLASATLVLTACAGSEGGGGDTAGSEGGGGDTADSASGSIAETREAPADLEEFTTYAEEIVADFAAEQENTAPTEGPEIVEGKNIAIIPCNMAAEGCARYAEGAQEAAEAAGWTTDIFDPAGDPSQMAALIDQAVGRDYDAIVLGAIDTSVVQASIENAIDAGMLVGNLAAEDTDPPLLTSNVPLFPDFFFDQGYAIGAQVFLDHGPELEIAMLTGVEFGSVAEKIEGVRAFMDDCGDGCEIVAEENFLSTDLVGSLPSQTAGMVRSNPNIDALVFGYDAGADFGIQGLEEAGIEVDTYGFDANLANLERIRDGRGQVATAGAPMAWAGWGLIDNLNRVWAGEEPIDQGIESKLLTADNLSSEGGAWDGDVDVTDNYLSIWGVN